MTDNNFCLVLCYAKWCGHCTRYYIKNEDGTEKEIKISKDGPTTWQEVRDYVEEKLKCNVTQFEETELKENKNKDFNLESMIPEGWPTIMMCKRSNEKEKYEKYRLFKGDRTNLEDIRQFIKNCISGEEEKEEKEGKQTGGSTDYRIKYKKYKQMYSDLVNKYNTLKNKN